MESWLEESKRKGRNNRILGFFVGVLFTMFAFILWGII